MSTGLNVNDVVAVSISLSATPAGFRNFGACLVIGSSDVIDVGERIRQYSDIEGVASDFGTAAPEYLWSQEFFSQSPRPNLLYVGRWAQNATSGIVHGAGLTPLQRLLANFTAITSGAFLVSVDGVPYALTGLNFSAATNLNGVASIIQTALQGAGAANALVTWDANNFRFSIESGTTGIASTLSYARSPAAVGSFTFASQPSASSIITPNGTAVTFVASGATGNQVNIGASLAATLANLVTFLNSSADVNISKATWSLAGSTVYGVSDATGTAGNAYTLVAGTSPATNATVSGATFAGGVAAGDISVLTGLSLTTTSTGSNADVPVAGVAAETLLSAAELFGDSYGTWYALSVATATPPSDADHIAVAGYIEAAGQARIYGIGSQNTTLWDDTRSDDLASVLKAAGYSRTMIDFSTYNAYAIASMFGRFATVNYDGSNTTITLKFKQQPGITPELLTETQASTLDSKNANYFVTYQNGTAILQQGVMSSGIFIDQRINADWFANNVQTNVYNLLRGSNTKIPQTDAGMALLATAMGQSCQQAVINGYLAPGVWNTDGFGTLSQGDFLPKGWEIYVPLVASQNETDRALRKTPLFQIAAKEAGAVHHADIAITVNP